MLNFSRDAWCDDNSLVTPAKGLTHGPQPDDNIYTTKHNSRLPCSAEAAATNAAHALPLFPAQFAYLVL